MSYLYFLKQCSHNFTLMANVAIFIYVVISNLTNPIPKLIPLSIIELVAKKKATPMVQPLCFVGMGRLPRPPAPVRGSTQ